jgi:hypothetical protein
MRGRPSSRYFFGHDDADILACYLDPARAEHDEKDVEAILELARQKSKRPTPPPLLPPSHQVRPASPSDVDAMADLYRRVFETYPFPIHDPDYLTRTIERGIVYYGIWKEHRLLALSSAETRSYALSVEMTDFATDPDPGAPASPNTRSRAWKTIWRPWVPNRVYDCAGGFAGHEHLLRPRRLCLERNAVEQHADLRPARAHECLAQTAAGSRWMKGRPLYTGALPAPVRPLHTGAMIDSLRGRLQW